jgi:starch-binding outer membrane protein, SusD/RagB family
MLNFNFMKKIFIYSIAALSILLTSCTDYVDDINEDPDSLTDADSKNLFQSALLANQFLQTSASTRTTMIWLNQANGENRQYVALNNWNNSIASEFDDTWAFAYNTLTQAKLIQEKALVENNPRTAGAAQVIEAMAIGTATQLWGDVPYSDFKVDGSNLNPKFDSQASVYAQLQTTLNQAITKLNSTVGVGIPSDKDFYYNGNSTKWIQLANSLKARYYLHVKNYPMAKTFAALGINSAGNDFKAQFGNTYLQNFNPFYSFLVYDRDDYMSGDSYAARLLDPTNALYRGNAKTNESARFIYNYLDNGEYFDPYTLNIYGSDYGGTNGKFGSDSPVPMVTYGEMLLITAEADARISGVPAGVAAYNTYRQLLDTGYSIGIDNLGYETQVFNYDDYTTADFAASGIENPDNISDLNAFLRELYQERYVYFLGTFECYTDFGRTNNVAGIQLKPGNTGTPQRLIYPQTEINSNGANVPSPLPLVTAKTPVHL